MARSEHRVGLSEREWDSLANDLKLSPRQVEIARLISQGMADKQIAWQLGISFGTLRTHIGRLYQKCQVNDRLELLAHVYAAVNESRQNNAAPLSGRGSDMDSGSPLWVRA